MLVRDKAYICLVEECSRRMLKDSSHRTSRNWEHPSKGVSSAASGRILKRRNTVWIPEEGDIPLRIICTKENKGLRFLKRRTNYTKKKSKSG